MINSQMGNEGLDLEWVQLIMEAKKLGLDKEEIKRFLTRNVAEGLMIKNCKAI